MYPYSWIFLIIEASAVSLVHISMKHSVSSLCPARQIDAMHEKFAYFCNYTWEQGPVLPGPELMVANEANVWFLTFQQMGSCHNKPLTKYVEGKIKFYGKLIREWVLRTFMWLFKQLSAMNSWC